MRHQSHVVDTSRMETTVMMYQFLGAGLGTAQQVQYPLKRKLIAMGAGGSEAHGILFNDNNFYF